MTSSGGRRVALVTGAASRIGAYLAAVAAADGYALHLHTGHRHAELARTARRLAGAHGVRVTEHVVDLRSHQAVTAWAHDLRTDPPALIVNNASYFPPPDGPGPAGWEQAADAIAVHALAPLVLAGTLADQGHIVNVLDARLPLLDGARTCYEIAKHTLASLTLLHARRLAPGVRVNALAPGLVLASRSGADLEALAHDRAPLRRPATLADLGAALRFLDHAPSVTGQVIYVDAGEHLGQPGQHRDNVNPPRSAR